MEEEEIDLCECGHYKEDHNEKGCLKNKRFPYSNGTICSCKKFKQKQKNKDGKRRI